MARPNLLRAALSYLLPFLGTILRIGRVAAFLFLGGLHGAFAAPTTPTSDFTDHGDGTVTDTATGLQWMRCAMGQTWTGSTCSGTAGNYSWDQAMVLKTTFAGNSDWRLPSVKELFSITDHTKYAPAIDSVAFPNAPALYFWAASAKAGNSVSAWFVNFNFGYSGYHTKDHTFQVRLTRGGQSFDALRSYTPTSDFADDGDGTTAHRKTGLMWKRCAEGQYWTGTTCTGTANTYTWNEAVALRSTFSDRADWRLPTVRELQSIVEYQSSAPPINTEIFPNTSSTNFWSASTYAASSNLAWLVNFRFGYASNGYRVSRFQVRLVRTGQPLSSFSLTATKGGPGSGTITSSPSGIDCGSTCSGSYLSGTTLTLTAVPTTGSTFAGWSGACTNASVTCTLSMSAAKSVTATFNLATSLPQTTLTPDFTDNGDGTVTHKTTGLTWMRCAIGQTWSGSTCAGSSRTYTWSQARTLTSGFAGRTDWRLPSVVELLAVSKQGPMDTATVFPYSSTNELWSASPYAGEMNVGWYVYFYEGIASTSDQTMARDVRLVRGGKPFDPLALYTPTSDFTDNGDGTVKHNTTGLTWMRCAFGQTWTGSTCTGSGAPRYWWDQARTLTTSFAGRSDWRLPTIGEIQSIVEYRAYGPAINSVIFPGTPTTLYIPMLDFWSSYVDSSAGGLGAVFRVDFSRGEAYSEWLANNSYIRFVRGGPVASSFALAVSKAGTGSGIVRSGSAGIDCGATCTASFATGSTVTLTATPSADSTLQGWTGCDTSSGTSCTVKVDSAKTVTAIFSMAVVTPALTMNCLFDWAEASYPSLFAPSRAQTLELPPYAFRHYPQTSSYLGVSSADNHLYYLGPLSQNSALDVGVVGPWYGQSGCGSSNRLTTKTVDSVGGTVSIRNLADPLYGIEINVPSGALTVATTISMQSSSVTVPLPQGLTTSGTTISLTPSPSTFLKPATITFPYVGEEVPLILSYSENGQRYEVLPLVSVDSTNKRVTVQTSHFSLFAKVTPSAVERFLATQLGSHLKSSTGFQIGKDNFTLQNLKSYFPGVGGACYGFSTFSKWYFENKKATEGPLSERYTATSCDPVQTNSQKILREAEALHETVGKVKYFNVETYQFYRVALALLTTGRTQLLNMGNSGDEEHSVLVYGLGYDSASKLYQLKVYDSSYPGFDSMVEYDSTKYAFRRYVNLAGAFDVFYYPGEETFMNLTGLQQVYEKYPPSACSANSSGSDAVTMTATVSINGVNTSAVKFGDAVSASYSVTYTISNATANASGYVGEVAGILEVYKLGCDLTTVPPSNCSYRWVGDALVDLPLSRSSETVTGTITGTSNAGNAYLSTKMRLHIYFAANGQTSAGEALSNEIAITH